MSVIHFNEGQQHILDVYFGGITFAGPFYLGLGVSANTSTLPPKTATLASITEVACAGYSRKSITRDQTGTGWGAAALNSGDYMVTNAAALVINTTASPSSGNATYAFLCTVSSGTSGKLLSAANLTNAFSGGNGAQLTINTYTFKEQ